MNYHTHPGPSVAVAERNYPLVYEIRRRRSGNVSKNGSSDTRLRSLTDVYVVRALRVSVLVLCAGSGH